MKGLPKDMQPIVREYEKKGWNITFTGGTHLRWTHPSGRSLVTGYTVKGRAALNVRSRVRRLERDCAVQ